MDALDALINRVSVSRVEAPAPDADTREAIFRSALRAADHALLRPWRFLVLEGDARLRLGRLFAAASAADDPGLPPAKLDSIAGKPLRAPLLVIAISSPKDHPKVPRFEQELSAAAAVQNMLTAAFAQKIGAMWRTGPMASHPLVTQGLGLSGAERIIGFIYMGQIVGDVKPAPVLPVDDYFVRW